MLSNQLLKFDMGRRKIMRGGMHEFLTRQSGWTVLIGASILVGIIGYIDYITGYEISLFVFYAPPIVLAVWYGSKQIGIFVALLSAIVWWWADVKSGHPYLMNWVQGWDTMVRLVFFLFVVAGAYALKAQFELLERTQRLEREIIKISEREQQRIGQDLHDGLCQYLAAIACAASSLRNDLQKHSHAEAEAATEIAELLKQGVTQARNISKGLFPVQTDEEGLESALEELAASATRLLGIECEFFSPGHVPIHDNTTATHLYRISQEALNNATKHGHATRVRIELSAKNDTVSLIISDNGKGLPDAAVLKADGMGLKIMDYRARVVGGMLEVKNGGSGGVVVCCSLRQTMKENERES